VLDDGGRADKKEQNANSQCLERQITIVVHRPEQYRRSEKVSLTPRRLGTAARLAVIRTKRSLDVTDATLSRQNYSARLRLPR
jgi:hypothetical protein